MRAQARPIPFHHFAIVASAGLVAFLAFWQGVLSLMNYRPCVIINPDYVVKANQSAALTEFGIAVVAIIVLFVGARRLRADFESGITGYILVVTSLLLSESLLSFVFLRLFTNCAS